MGTSHDEVIESLSKDVPLADVFEYLFENASDAMPEGGKLTITRQESSGNLEIAFTETGVGMSEETLDKLWPPLFTAKAKGMGLGLSICKRLVEAHGGSISVKSHLGEGTTFTVIVPFSPN
jgi:signal transduction histidine kinase